ncbi:hypothetical protein [Streptomyces canus]|uniref:hypothetical protein n=1 Tax=Streptomyces canus TaxID=58343 RepID=UPI002E3349BD|nr:hypothetical protein [Streptomyces canus]
MTARRIDTRTPNQAAAQPATARAGQQDWGTSQDRADRAEAVLDQQESTRFHAKASAEAAVGCR